MSVVLVLALFLTLGGLSQASVPGIPGVVASGATVELVKDGFQFTEGPVGTADGGLYFTDLRANKMYRLDPSGGITLFRGGTGGANGLALDRSGNLLAAEGESRRVIRLDHRATVTAVATHGAGRAFQRPNDLIVDRHGGIYVTDPGRGRRQRTAFIYYIRPDGQVRVVSNAIRRPNGLTLTPDEKVLIVADTAGKTLFAFDIQADGSLANRRAFASLRGIPDGMRSGADGVAVDSDGRLYATSVAGVQVFDAGGRYLGTIPVPRKPVNLAFSGRDKRTLYITAWEGLYRLRMLSRGPERPGK